MADIQSIKNRLFHIALGYLPQLSSFLPRFRFSMGSFAPITLTKVFFCNSGTEANENAMRMARMATGREDENELIATVSVKLLPNSIDRISLKSERLS